MSVSGVGHMVDVTGRGRTTMGLRKSSRPLTVATSSCSNTPRWAALNEGMNGTIAMLEGIDEDFLLRTPNFMRCQICDCAQSSTSALFSHAVEEHDANIFDVKVMETAKKFFADGHPRFGYFAIQEGCSFPVYSRERVLSVLFQQPYPEFDIKLTSSEMELYEKLKRVKSKKKAVVSNRAKPMPLRRPSPVVPVDEDESDDPPSTASDPQADASSSNPKMPHGVSRSYFDGTRIPIKEVLKSEMLKAAVPTKVRRPAYFIRGETKPLIALPARKVLSTAFVSSNNANELSMDDLPLGCECKSEARVIIQRALSIDQKSQLMLNELRTLMQLSAVVIPAASSVPVVNGPSKVTTRFVLGNRKTRVSDAISEQTSPHKRRRYHPDDDEEIITLSDDSPPTSPTKVSDNLPNSLIPDVNEESKSVGNYESDDSAPSTSANSGGVIMREDNAVSDHSDASSTITDVGNASDLLDSIPEPSLAPINLDIVITPDMAFSDFTHQKADPQEEPFSEDIEAPLGTPHKTGEDSASISYVPGTETQEAFSSGNIDVEKIVPADTCIITGQDISLPTTENSIVEPERDEAAEVFRSASWMLSGSPRVITEDNVAAPLGHPTLARHITPDELCRCVCRFVLLSPARSTTAIGLVVDNSDIRWLTRTSQRLVDLALFRLCAEGLLQEEASIFTKSSLEQLSEISDIRLRLANYALTFDDYTNINKD